MDATLPAIDQLRDAASIVHRIIPPTPQLRWPLLSEHAGAEVWIKHENHTPLGAFKVRGGLVYVEHLRREHPEVRGVISATRGNHGQSVAFAASRAGLRSVVVVPRGNSREKNAAMRSLGAELLEHGEDFQAAYEYAVGMAREQALHFFPSFHQRLIAGVASYSLELFEAAPDLDTLYVPIGMGSGICGAIACRDALGLKTEIVGVVAAGAPSYALSFTAGRPVSTDAAITMADGVACRVPDADAVRIIRAGASRVVTVEDREIGAAMRLLFSATHNVAEGAGAAGLAALLQERSRIAGRRVATVLSGGNIDRELYARILADG